MFDCRFYTEWTTYTYSEIIWAWFPFETYNVHVINYLAHFEVSDLSLSRPFASKRKKCIKKNDKCCEWWCYVQVYVSVLQ